MYKKHSIWDEDKWDIHSNSSSSYAPGHGLGKSSAGYAGSVNPTETYHKSQLYNSNDKDKIKDMYKSNEAQEEDKKKKEQGGKTLADAVQKEQKHQKKPENNEVEMQKKNTSAFQGEHKQNDDPKKRNKSSIEEAINDAIKEEKEVIHLD